MGYSKEMKDPVVEAERSDDRLKMVEKALITGSINNAARKCLDSAPRTVKPKRKTEGASCHRHKLAFIQYQASHHHARGKKL